jgi:acetyl-CoA C-acetyltransferase
VTDAVIVAAGRTPIGRANKGSLRDCRPDDLAAGVVQQVWRSVPELAQVRVEDLILGCGQPAGESGQNLARVVAVLAGMTDTPGVTINRFCASSLQAIRMAAHAVRSGDSDGCYIAAGVETVSRYPNGTANTGPHNPRFAQAEKRTQRRRLPGRHRWAPAEGLPDVYISMGDTAENVADIEGVTRAEMDQFALLSQQRAVAAQKNGYFAREIAPVTTPDGTVVATDDGPRPDTTAGKLAALKPVFRDDGRVTAGNACPLNDGAAAVVVMGAERAAELGIRPLARIVATAVTALEPEVMGLGPVAACRQALARAGMTIDDIDLAEINEAFAAQVIPCARHLGLDWDRLNVHGGAIALGHPFGMTGARIATTLINGLTAADKTIGLESMCVGGGQGMAMIIERLS